MGGRAPVQDAGIGVRGAGTRLIIIRNAASLVWHGSSARHYAIACDSARMRRLAGVRLDKNGPKIVFGGKRAPETCLNTAQK